VIPTNGDAAYRDNGIQTLNIAIIEGLVMTYEIAPMVEGAVNHLVDMGTVSPGESVLVLTQLSQDDQVPAAYAAAARQAGADATIMVVDDLEATVGTRIMGKDVPDHVKQAMWNYDVVVDALLNFIHPNEEFINKPMMENGLRWIWGPYRTKTLNAPYSRFPAELIYAMIEKDYEIVTNGDRIRVTDPKGTNISADIDTGFIASGTGVVRGLRSMHPGMFITPSGIIGQIHNLPNANGEVYFDNMDIATEPGDEPAHWRVEDSWIVEIDGPKTEPWQRMAEEDARATLFSEIMWSYNPKQSIKDNWPEYEPVTRHAGVVHMAIGSPPSRGGGDPEKTSSHPLAHTHGLLLEPSVYIDGEPIVEDGRLQRLDDPEIRELASKYGDPDEVLREVE